MLRRTVHTALLVALLGAPSLTGCEENQNPIVRNDGGITGEVGRSCNVDDECGGLRCDPIRRQCICLSDGDCVQLHPAGDLVYCNNFTGLCVDQVDGCTSDSSCSAGSYCDPTVRACKTRKGFCEPCGADLECGGENDHCLLDATLKSHFCGKACADNADCPSGAVCSTVNGTKQCWPENGKNCKVFLGCTPDSKKSCASNADCNDVPGQICDPALGICVARIQSCPFGQVCDGRSKVCVDACGSDADCISIDPKLRCVNRACEPIGECAASATDSGGDKSCPTNKVCSFNPGTTSGTCVPFCGSDAECPLGSVCTTTSDNRRKCMAGCRSSGDCALDKVCVKPAGSNLGTCQGTAGKTCQSDIVCPACATCDTTANACVVRSMATDGYCKPCGTDNDCGTGPSHGHCLNLGGVRRCGQPCPATGCPQGFNCTDVCVGGTYSAGVCSGGQIFAECVPVDLDCATAAGADKCLP